jgi:uncharacterized membrane protein (UPF0127 family)
MKRFLLGGCAGVVLLCGALYWWGWWGGQTEFIAPTRVSMGRETFTLEVAQTDEARAMGLGERDSLCQECGMLFVFPRSERYVFWMQGMRFPLDIAWIEDDVVAHIERWIPSESKERYQPAQPASRVLEVNAGALDGVSVGDSVAFQ